MLPWGMGAGRGALLSPWFLNKGREDLMATGPVRAMGSEGVGSDSIQG